MECRQKQRPTASRRRGPVEEHNQACFILSDKNGQGAGLRLTHSILMAAAFGPAGVKTARSAFASLSLAPWCYNHSMSDWSDEETDDPLVADARNFYKVEKWTGDGLRVVDLLYAGSSVDRAHAIFATMVRHWPSIRLTIRQRTRVLQEWPPR